jgi:hypothetical protein
MCAQGEDTRAAISDGMKAYWADPETRVKRREAARLKRIDRRKKRAADVLVEREARANAARKALAAD